MDAARGCLLNKPLVGSRQDDKSDNGLFKKCVISSNTVITLHARHPAGPGVGYVIYVRLSASLQINTMVRAYALAQLSGFATLEAPSH